MNRLNCTVLLVSSALTIMAQEGRSSSLSHLRRTENAEEHDVVACLELDEAGSFISLGPSKAITSQIFERIGVRLRWSCEESMFAQPEHSKSFILIRLAGNTPNKLHRGALAYALPYANAGVRIVVFYDRFEALIENGPISTDNVLAASTILAYVFAHEIGHVLSGVAAHADEGVMRARWTSDDFYSMTRGWLSFDPLDADLIRENVKRDFDRRAPAE